MADKSIERVAVVIPNLNGEDHIKKAVDSLLDQTFVATIIVVENASTDKSLGLLREYGSKIVIIENKKNLGFAGGVNTGIQHALEQRFDAVALLNNDADAEKDWLENLVESLTELEDVGIVASSIQRTDKQHLDSTGEFYTSWGLPYPRGRNKPINEYNEAGYIFGASGGASIYRTKMFREIGLFDEAFFAYYEDVDISFRAQLAGWKVYFQPKAIVYHAIGQTSSRMGSGFSIYQTFKNVPLLFIKNVPFPLLLPIGIRLFIAYWLMLAKAIIHGRGWPAMKGLCASFILGFGAVLKRWDIQHHKKVSTNYIKKIIVHDLPPDQSGLRKLRKVFIGR